MIRLGLAALLILLPFSTFAGRASGAVVVRHQILQVTGRGRVKSEVAGRAQYNKAETGCVCC
ncbi:MAG: hypothetical protein ACK5LJ_04280 [Paracoccus sp. (in: a-proteobacteria)]